MNRYLIIACLNVLFLFVLSGCGAHSMKRNCLQTRQSVRADSLLIEKEQKVREMIHAHLREVHYSAPDTMGRQYVKVELTSEVQTVRDHQVEERKEEVLHEAVSQATVLKEDKRFSKASLLFPIAAVILLLLVVYRLVKR